MRVRLARRLLLALATLAPLVAAAQPKPPLVLAAASLRESMSAAADAWAKKRHMRPVLAFAASSALAKQIEAGAPADLFASADEAWMDDAVAKGVIAPGTRADWLGNRLAIVEPTAGHTRLAFTPAGLAPLARGPLAMADPSAVPAGLYGKAALEKLGAWAAVSAHVVRVENVRAALALVERGAAPFGIVYATDALASRAVRVAGVFPEASHPPIRYPLARVRTSGNADAEGFRRFLLSREGKAIFVRFGFTAL